MADSIVPKTDPGGLRFDPTARFPELYKVRLSGDGSKMAAALRGDIGSTEPYELPRWARTPTYTNDQVAMIQQSVGATPQQQSQPSYNAEGFPIRIETPDPFARDRTQGQMPPGMEGVPEEVLVAMGAMPGRQRGGSMDLMGHNVATLPVSMANFETWFKEGGLALLSSLFLGGAYQEEPGTLPFEDTEYQGPGKLDPHQQIIKSVIESRKALGDAAFAPLSWAHTQIRQQDGLTRLMQVRDLFATGSAPEFYFEGTNVRGVTSALTTRFADIALGRNQEAMRYSLAGILKVAEERGLDPYSTVARLYDLDVALVMQVASDKDITDDELAELSKGPDGQGVPWSVEPVSDMAVNASSMLAMIGVGFVGMRSGAAFSGGLARGLAPTTARAFSLGLRGGGLRGSAGLQGAARAAGWGTRSMIRLNMLDTGVGWSVRTAEWALKQAAVTLDNQELVAFMDYLMFEKPTSNNPGLQLMDAFALHPARALKPLLGRTATGDRMFHVGTPDTPGHVGSVNFTTRRWTRPVKPETGYLDIEAVNNITSAGSPVEVIIAGKRQTLPADHPQAVMVARAGSLSHDDIIDTVLKDTGWERDMLAQTFGEGNPHGFTWDHLRQFVIYGYGQIVRDNLPAQPRIYGGSTAREMSNSFFRQNTPEILELFASDLSGKSNHLGEAIKGQWWSLWDVPASELAPMKARLYSEYSPVVAFENMKHWLITSDTINTALRQGADIEDYVPAFSRKVNRRFLQDFRERITRKYTDPDAIIPDEEVQRFRARTGLVEELDPTLRQDRQTPERQWTQRQFLDLLDRIERAGEDPKNKAVTFTDSGDSGVPIRDADLPRNELVWTDEALAINARVLGLLSEHVIAIEAVKKAGGSTKPPNMTIINRVSEVSPLGARSLRAMEPDEAWKVIIDWYDRRIGMLRSRNFDTRVPLLDFRDVMDALISEGLIDDALGYQAARASSRIAAEAVNPPKQVLTEPKQEVRMTRMGRYKDPETGTVYPDPHDVVGRFKGRERTTMGKQRVGRDATGAAERYRAAMAAGQTVARKIKGHLEKPERRGRIVRTTDEATPDYVATPETAAVVHKLGTLASWVRDNPGVIPGSDDVALAGIVDMNIHPLLKADELLKLDWTEAPPDIALLVRDFQEGFDGKPLAQEIVDELVPLQEGSTDTMATRLSAALDASDAYLRESQDLAGEIVQANMGFDNVRGRTSQQFDAVSDRVAFDPNGATVMYEPLDTAVRVSRGTPEGRAVAREQTQLARERTALRSAETELSAADNLIAQRPELAEMTEWVRARDLAGEPVGTFTGRGGKDAAESYFRPIALDLHEGTGLGYKAVRSGNRYVLMEGDRILRQDPEAPTPPVAREPEVAPAAPETEPKMPPEHDPGIALADQSKEVQDAALEIRRWNTDEARAAREEARAAREAAAPERHPETMRHDADRAKQAEQEPGTAEEMSDGRYHYKPTPEEGGPGGYGATAEDAISSYRQWVADGMPDSAAQMNMKHMSEPGMRADYGKVKGKYAKTLVPDVRAMAREGMDRGEFDEFLSTMRADEAISEADEAALRSIFEDWHPEAPPARPDDVGTQPMPFEEPAPAPARAAELRFDGEEPGTLGPVAKQPGSETKWGFLDEKDVWTGADSWDQAVAMRLAYKEGKRGDELLARSAEILEEKKGEPPIGGGSDTGEHILSTDAAPERVTGNPTDFPGWRDETADIPATFELLDIDALKASDDPTFPSELQPRDRAGRKTSAEGIEKMTRTWKPKLAHATGTGFDGPPVIGFDDNVVLVGNGRTMAMRNLSDKQWAAHKKYLRENAELYGLTPDDVDAIDRPVLVRRVADDVMTEENAVGFNLKEGLGSGPEVARILSRRITTEEIAALGDLTEQPVRDVVRGSPEHQAWAKARLESVVGHKRTADTWLNKDGTLSEDGAIVIERAMLSKVLADSDAASRILESSETATRFRRALEMTMGELLREEAKAQLRDTGFEPIGRYLSEALADIIDRQARGQTYDAMAQTYAMVGLDLEGAPLSPQGQALAHLLVSLDTQKEVATFLRTYAQEAGNGQMVGMFESAGMEGAPSLARYVNSAISNVENQRKSAGMAKGQKWSQADDLPRMPEPGGEIRSTFDDATDTPRASVEEPVMFDEVAAPGEVSTPRAQNTLDSARDIYVDDLITPPGDPERVIFWAHNSTHADVVRELQAVDQELLDGELRRLGQEFSAVRDDAAGFAGWLEQAVDAINGVGPSRHNRGLWYAFIRTTTGSDNWLDTGRYAPKFEWPLKPSGLKVRDLTTAARNLDDIEVIGQGTAATGDDAVLMGTRPRTMRPDHQEVTSIADDQPPQVRQVEEAAEAGTPVVISHADEATHRAGQQVGNLARGRRVTEILLNEPDENRILATLERRRAAALARRDTLKRQVEIREQRVESMPGAEVDPGVVLPADIDALYRRYVFDDLATVGMEAPAPATLFDVLDAIRSLDFEVAARAGQTMDAAELTRLREGLLAFAEAKLDERGIASLDDSLTPESLRQQGIEVIDLDTPPTTPVARAPTDHSALLRQLERQLNEVLYEADEPIEGYAGVGYRITRAPNRPPESPTLFYTHELTDQLARYDRLIPGLGAELDSGRQPLLATRIRQAQDDQAARSLAGEGENRNWIKKALDTAFGPRSQKDIQAEAVERFVDTIAPAADAKLKARLGRGLISTLHNNMREQKFGPLPFGIYRRVGHLRTDLMEKWSRDYMLADKKFRPIYEELLANSDSKTPVWDAWREADNRIRAYFSEQDGGAAKFIDWLYETGPVRRGSQVFSGLNVLYGVVRFFVDSRWLAMDAVEAPMMLLGREGPGAVWEAAQLARGKRDTKLLFGDSSVVNQLKQRYAWWMEAGDAGGYFRWRDSSLVTMVERGQARELTKYLEGMARQDDVLAQMLRESGDTPLQYVHKLDRDWRIMSARNKKLTGEQLDDLLADYVKNGTITPDELAAIKTEGKWTHHPDLEAAIASADDPRLRAMYERLNVIQQQTWNDASNVIFGQLDRSNTQRLLNSPFLYWPLSYQIKATRWLYGMLFDRVGGLDTGAAGATLFDWMMEDFQTRLQGDEDFQNFLKEHKAPLFAAQMFFPITPWDAGVSLSPFTRSFLSMLTDEPDVAYQRGLFSFGPMYSINNLYPRILRDMDEADIPVLSDVAEKMRYIFPLQYSIPVKGEKKTDVPAGLVRPQEPEQPATRFGP